MKALLRPLIWGGLVVAAYFGLARAGGDVGAAIEPGRFEVRFCRSGEGWQAIRFDSARGDAWQVTDERWMPITDAAPVPPGRYDVLMIDSGRADWAALRVEKVSGKTWYASGGRWHEISGP